MNKKEYEAGETEEEKKEKKEIEKRKNNDAYFVMPYKGDSRYTAEGLPILTESTRKAFMNELERSLEMEEDHKARLKHWISEISEENPEVADFIGRVVSAYPDCFKFITCTALAELYHMLKSQINNNNIFDYFKIGEYNSN